MPQSWTDTLNARRAAAAERARAAHPAATSTAASAPAAAPTTSTPVVAPPAAGVEVSAARHDEVMRALGDLHDALDRVLAHLHPPVQAADEPVSPETAPEPPTVPDPVETGPAGPEGA